MVPNEGVPSAPPLPFSDVDPISQEDAIAAMGGEPGEGIPSEQGGFDASADQAPAYWPQELATLWPNLPPETRETLDAAIASGSPDADVDGGGSYAA
jgi:hypothetical protein